MYVKDAVILMAKMAERGDPGKDPNWASDATFLSWDLDTNGDGATDFVVEWLYDNGKPVVGVSRPNDTQINSVCEGPAVYGQESHAAGFDPKCIGSPPTFSYRVTIYYDTDPKNPNADVITDVAPNGGLSRPVPRSAN